MRSHNTDRAATAGGARRGRTLRPRCSCTRSGSTSAEPSPTRCWSPRTAASRWPKFHYATDLRECFFDAVRGVTERVGREGTIVVSLDEHQLRSQVEELLTLGAAAFAVCFPWSFVNETHERRAREIIKELAPHAFVSISGETAPRIGAYNRTVATVINTCLGPATSR